MVLLVCGENNLFVVWYWGENSAPTCVGNTWENVSNSLGTLDLRLSRKWKQWSLQDSENKVHPLWQRRFLLQRADCEYINKLRALFIIVYMRWASPVRRLITCFLIKFSLLIWEEEMAPLSRSRVSNWQKSLRLIAKVGKFLDFSKK